MLLETKKTITLTLILLAIFTGCSSIPENKVSPKYAAGMGALLRENDGIEVVAVAEGYPADKAGIKIFDKILQIGGIPTLGLNLAETTLLIRGPEDTTLTLLVQSPELKQPHRITITRKTMDPQKIKWKESSPPTEHKKK